MKREYSKPTIHVEVMSMDMPIAGACQSSYDETPELKAQGWFLDSNNCMIILGNNSENKDYYVSGGDTLCYHSHVRTTFSS